MEKTRVAFIGAGALASRYHYPSVAGFDDVEIVANCDIDEARAREIAAQHGIPNSYSDYRKMLDEHEVDGVFAILRPQHSFEVVVDLLQRGLPVFVEKPLGNSYQEARSLAHHAAQTGCKTMVGFNRRFAPAMLRAKEEVGDVIHCVSTFYKSGGTGEKLGYYNGSQDILYCDAVHAVDALRFMAGSEPRALASVVTSYDYAQENAFTTLIHFESGATGVLLANWAVGTRIHTFEMHGMGVSAFVDYVDVTRVYRGQEQSQFTAAEVAGTDEDRIINGFTGEDRHFIDCLREDRQPQTHFGNAVLSQKLVRQIYHSSLTDCEGVV